MCAPERAQVEALADTHASGVAQSSPEVRVGDQPAQSLREQLRVAGWNEQPRLTVRNELRHAADPGGDDWQAGGHRFEDGDGHALRCARKHEDVSGRKQVGDVVALAREADTLFEAQSLDLALQSLSVWAVADDQELAAFRRQRGDGPDEGQEVLRRLQPADCDEPWHLSPVACPRRDLRIDRVRDHHRRPLAARACGEARGALVLGYADRHGCQRPHEPVGPSVEPRRDSRVGRERPSVHREDPDRNAGENGGKAAEHARLRAAGVEDVGPLAAQQSDELEQAGDVSPGVDRPADVAQRQEPDAARLCGFPERAGPVRGDRDVEAAESGEQRRDVRLRAADLGERDQHQQPRTPRVGA